MYFNDGEDPWTVEENFIKVFDFNNLNGATWLLPNAVILISFLMVAQQMI